MRQADEEESAKPAAWPWQRLALFRYSIVCPDNSSCRASKLFLPTLRDAPADADAATSQAARARRLVRVARASGAFMHSAGALHQKIVPVVPARRSTP